MNGSLSDSPCSTDFFSALSARNVDRDRATYLSARPFPYIVLDDLFPAELAAHARAQFPALDDPIWKTDGELFEIEGVARKFALAKMNCFPPALREITELCHSEAFVRYVEQVTGLDNLVCDPNLFGGGLNMVGTGGRLEVHADYNFNNSMKMYRCVNALVYLADDWKAEWGGALELWDKEMKGPPEVVVPTGNRLLIFATNDETFHGYGPVTEPTGRTRNSINIYYHRDQPAPGMTAQPHKTIWKAVHRETAGEGPR